MNMMAIRILIFGSIIFFTSCNSKTCDSVPDYFSSSDEGIAKIMSSEFRMRDSIDNSDGEWLMAANYYSCDRKTGFFVYKLKSGIGNYSQGVPISIWRDFKNSVSKESFYEDSIKAQYPAQVRIDIHGK